MKQKLTALAFSALLGASTLMGATVGQPAPNFTLTDTNGVTHSLSDFSGKLVVLEWVNHGCPFVVKHYRQGHMQALQAKYAEKDVVWLKICSSAPGEQGHMSNEAWNAANKRMNVAAAAVLIDEDGTVGRKYDARVTPHMYVIDRDGILVYNGAIDDIRSANTADIARANNYVVAALDALLSGQPVAVATTTPYGCTVKYAR